VKILAFSDLHCDLEAATRLVEAAKDADLVIGAGDFAQMHQGLEETMEALEPIVDRSIFIPGNNETFDALRSSTGALVVHNERLDLDGLYRMEFLRYDRSSSRRGSRKYGAR